MGHHFVPQEYLRGFSPSDIPGQIWQFDKEKLQFSGTPIPITKVAQRKQFYPSDTESELNRRVEVPANAVLSKLRSGNFRLESSEKATLAYYIANMICRVPEHRLKVDELAPTAIEGTSRWIKQWVDTQLEQGAASDEEAREFLAGVERFQELLKTRMPGEFADKIYHPWPSERLCDAIFEMHWRFVSAVDGQHFVTSDNPAFYFSGEGFGDRKSEFTFPVSSKLAIFGSWTKVAGNEGLIESARISKEANRRLISGATRFVFSSGNSDWISAVAGKKQVFLSRIAW